MPGLGWRDVQNILAASATPHRQRHRRRSVPGTNENGNWFLNDAANWNGGGMHFSNDYGYGLRRCLRRRAHGRGVVAVRSGADHAPTSTWWQNCATMPTHAYPTTTALDHSDDSQPHRSRHRHRARRCEIDLTHSNFTQLRIFLVSPDGTEVQLFDGSGGTDTTTDSALTWTYGVDALRGENATGTWTVRIEDSGRRRYRHAALVRGRRPTARPLPSTTSITTPTSSSP